MIAFSKLLCRGAAATSLAVAPAQCLQLTATPTRGMMASLPTQNMFALFNTPTPTTITPSKRNIVASGSRPGPFSRRKLDFTAGYHVSDTGSDTRTEKLNFDTPEHVDSSTPAPKTPTYRTPLRTTVVNRYLEKFNGKDSAEVRDKLQSRKGELVGFYKKKTGEAEASLGRPFALWSQRNNTCKRCCLWDDSYPCTCVFDVRGVAKEQKPVLQGHLNSVAAARQVVAKLHSQDRRDWGHQKAIDLAENTRDLVEAWRGR